MAKMFYSSDETEQKLGLSAEQLKKLVTDGKLREFRDGAKIMFKVDEVDNLNLAGLTGSGSGEIGLAPEEEDTGEMGLTPSDSADQISLDDTGEPAAKDDTVVTGHGINILDDSDELELADPLAQTQIAPEFDDQVHLDSGSSGSGLLDLTREADDTSLGAELLEEIYPGSDEGAIETQIPTELDVPSSTDSAMSMEEPVVLADYSPGVQIYDPTSGAFGVMMIVPFLVLILLACATASGITNAQPAFLDSVTSIIWYIVGGAGVLALIIAIAGFFFIGGQGGQPKAKKEKKPKAKKEKKPKKKK